MRCGSMYEIENILYEAEDLGIREEVIELASDLVDRKQIETFSDACFMAFNHLKEKRNDTGSSN